MHLCAKLDMAALSSPWANTTTHVVPRGQGVAAASHCLGQHDPNGPLRARRVREETDV